MSTNLYLDKPIFELNGTPAPSELTEVLGYLVREIEQLLYCRLTWERERRGRSVGFFA